MRFEWLNAKVVYAIVAVVAACAPALIPGVPKFDKTPPVDVRPVIALRPPIPPDPPSKVVAADHPDDKGEMIDVNWEASANDDATANSVTGYLVERSSSNGATWLQLGSVGPLTDPAKRGRNFVDDKKARSYRDYLYRIIAVGPRGASQPAQSEVPVSPVTQLFEWKQIWFCAIFVILCAVVIAFIFAARRGLPLRVRKIAGLEVVDEAVGRATEMGRACIFVPGIDDLNNIQTVAGITVLSRVAKTAAEYDARVEVPTSRSLVMTAARDTVQSSFLQAGRPDAYSDEHIYYVTDEQFGYVAFLAGKMVREKPAACFYMGAFYAESLILAETGNSIGAIQIAGTAEPSQLPFFVAACDYTLIGEEFFAASAYLSGEPDQLGSLKGQDLGKLFAAVLILLGCIVATFAAAEPDSETWKNRLAWLKDTVLNAGGGGE